MRLKLALWLAYKIGGKDFGAWRAERVRMGAKLTEHRITTMLQRQIDKLQGNPRAYAVETTFVLLEALQFIKGENK